MRTETREIAQDLAAARVELASHIEELADKAKDTVDWHSHYRRHASMFVGTAFAIGFLLSATRGRKNGGSRLMTGSANDQTASGPVRESRDVLPQRLQETWTQIEGALLGVASAKVVDFISSLIPGFREHYRDPQV